MPVPVHFVDEKELRRSLSRIFYSVEKDCEETSLRSSTLCVFHRPKNPRVSFILNIYLLFIKQKVLRDSFHSNNPFKFFLIAFKNPLQSSSRLSTSCPRTLFQLNLKPSPTSIKIIDSKKCQFSRKDKRICHNSNEIQIRVKVTHLILLVYSFAPKLI